MQIDKDIAIKFLVQCYFGDVVDPYLAAIDKAYFDMQTHTINGERESVFEMRRNGTEYLYNQLRELPENNINFDEWHKETSDKIHSFSYDKIEKGKTNKTTATLSYGQIQKWINMSIKYLCTLRLLGYEDVDSYYVDNIDKFHAPIDSFVLIALEEDKNYTWSTIQNYDDYLRLKNQESFVKEYKEWPQYAEKAKRKKDGMEKLADPNSYKRYIQDNYSNKGKKYCGEIRWKSSSDENK